MGVQSAGEEDADSLAIWSRTGGEREHGEQLAIADRPDVMAASEHCEARVKMKVREAVTERVLMGREKVMGGGWFVTSSREQCRWVWMGGRRYPGGSACEVRRDEMRDEVREI